MRELTGLFTTDGKPIYTEEYIADLRKREDGKKNSNIFIAQEGPQERDLHSNVDILVTGGNRGGGKANPYTTPVITPFGPVKMGDLKVGDVICTPYDGHREVTQIFEQGENTVYRLYLDDGTWVDCMDNHRFWARKQSGDGFYEMTARDLFNRYKIDCRPPRSLRRGISSYVEIPICGEVEMNEGLTEIDMPLHPFLLGYASGDGTWEFSTKGLVVKYDYYVRSKVYQFGLSYKNFKDGTLYIRGITPQNRKEITPFRIRTDAYIPIKYMTASKSVRWQYLKGIMHYGGRLKHRHPIFTCKNKRLVEQIAQMARSLGCWARTFEVTEDPKYLGMWRVEFVCPNDRDIFSKGGYLNFARNNAPKATSPNQKDILTKKVLWISRLKTKYPCRCITVSGSQHLYLTDAYTINHNTFTLLMEPMKDFENPRFNGVILRKERDDLQNIVNDSQTLYPQLGKYNRSKDDMTWNLNKGGALKFTYFDDDIEDFKIRFQGKQYSYIGFDEFTHVPYDKFKYMITTNRNAAGIRNRLVCTCNPDPLSWVRRFIDWWIGSDGYPIEARDGVVRYCYMKGDSVEQIVWGNTPHEVYMQCKDEIDKLWDPEFEKDGYDKERVFVKSVTFIRAELKFNKKLLRSDPNYLGNLANQSEEQQARDLGGNWNFMSLGDDMVKMSHLAACFANSQQLGDKVRRASCDVAFTGGDSCVLWLWIGFHVQDIFTSKLDAISTCDAVKAKLDEWGVTEDHFTYDLNGLGQTFKGYFKRAKPFNNLEAVDASEKNIYNNIKSKAAYLFATKLQNAEISFNPNILDRKFSGRGFENRKLRDILQDERKCLRQDDSKRDRGWCLIGKDMMKRLVGHSPDFIEGLLMCMIFFFPNRKVGIDKSWFSW